MRLGWGGEAGGKLRAETVLLLGVGRLSENKSTCKKRTSKMSGNVIGEN